MNNVLAMEFIGENGTPCTILLLIILPLTRMTIQKSISIIADLYKKANLVHGDLSEYNIFKTSKQLVVFDFGSAIDIRHPNAEKFLQRDINNINRFFIKRGISVEDSTKLFEAIVDMSFEKLIRIPNDRIAVLIGKSGTVKTKIEKLCFVSLDIDGETGEVLIKSEGNVEKIQPFKAMEIITAIGRGFSPENAMTLVKRMKILYMSWILENLPASLALMLKG